LLAGLAHAEQSDLSALAGIDAAIVPAYLDGLAAGDYPADPARVRLGYPGGLAARSAQCALPIERLSQPPAGKAEAVLLHRVRLTRAMSSFAAEVTPARSPVLAERPWLPAVNRSGHRILLSAHTPAPGHLIRGTR
jgi:hypothetical protein